VRITILRDMGSTIKAGAVVVVPDDLARALVEQGSAELPLPSVGGPGFDPGSDVLVPAALDHPAPESQPRPAPKPGSPPGSPEAVGRGKLKQKEHGA
jgi:hypothetical protein